MKTSWPGIVTRIIDVLLYMCFAIVLVVHFVTPIRAHLGFLKFSATNLSRPLLLIAGLWILKQAILLFTNPKFSKDKMLWYYLGIGTISGATLLLEVSITRIFSVAFFNHYASLIISTALFGMGFSGVMLSIFPFVKKFDFNKMLAVFSACFAASAILTLEIIVNVPLRFGNLSEESINFVYLGIYYLALALPFFFSGMVIALLLSNIPEKVNRLYFADLIGAGIGCFLVLPLVPKLGAPGTVMIAAAIGLVASLCFGRLVGKIALVTPIILLVLVALLLPLRDTHFRIKVHEGKRSFNVHEDQGEIEFSRWSPMSRIDVANLGGDKLIWIDGGSNQSFMKWFDGNLEALRQNEVWKKMAGIVYQLVEKPDVLTVGPSAGEEVLYALAWNPKSITGVELDPVICDIMQNEYREFSGNIYNQSNTRLINDEGRSFIRRSSEKFDIIQQINNASPAAIASGAMNISETYLITVEAFHDYLDHLEEGGYLYIRRWGAIRLATVAAQALRERGVKNPEEHMVIMYYYDPMQEFGGGQFLLKNGDFTEQELAVLRESLDDVIYGPEALGVTHPKYAEYRKLIADKDAWKTYAKLGIQMFPVTDDNPFFNHFAQFGKFDVENVPEEFRTVFEKYKNSDFSLLVILGEAAALSIVFILLPLYLFQRSGLRSPGKFRLLLYFSALGLGFMLIEIVLIQKFTLFMGNPVYSVTVVLFSLLVAAGCGSFLSEKLRSNLKMSLIGVIVGIVLLCWAELTFTPLIFKTFLGYSNAVRMLITVAMLFPLGMLMGMPFPLGVTAANRIAKPLIPWAWGINGYMSVISSVLCVILALSFGFKMVVWVACGVYLVGLAAMLSLQIPAAKS